MSEVFPATYEPVYGSYEKRTAVVLSVLVAVLLAIWGIGFPWGLSKLDEPFFASSHPLTAFAFVALLCLFPSCILGQIAVRLWSFCGRGWKKGRDWRYHQTWRFIYQLTKQQFSLNEPGNIEAVARAARAGIKRVEVTDDDNAAGTVKFASPTFEAGEGSIVVIKPGQELEFSRKGAQLATVRAVLPTIGTDVHI
jgi:hypothetical protein